MAKKKKKKKSKKARIFKRIFGTLLLLLLLSVLAAGFYIGRDIYPLAKDAYEFKQDIDPYLDGRIDWSLKKIKSTVITAKDLLDRGKPYLEKSYVQYLKRFDKFKPYFALAERIIPFIDEAYDTLIWPGFELLDNLDLSAIVADDGYDLGVIKDYIAIGEDMYAKGMAFADRALEFDYSPLTEHVPLSTLTYLKNKVESLYNEYLPFLDFLKAFMGDGENRTYMLIIQNAAEIRSTGGFPGSMALVYIRNNKLSFGDFGSWYPYLTWTVADHTYVSDTEYMIFTDWIAGVRDYGFNPDFRRMCEVWANSYTVKTGGYLDGILSLCPQILQELLKYAGAVKVSNGDILTGKNCVRYIQRDWYFRYQAVNEEAYNNDGYVGQLFSEAAMGSLSKITHSLSVSSLKGYIDVLLKSIDNRVFMAWMADPAEQRLVQAIGASGRLNYEAENPEVGLFFASDDPGRLGLFLDVDTVVSEPRENYDGSYSYDIKITYENVMTYDELATNASKWIIGHYGGPILARVYYFSPAGGEITSAYTSTGMYLYNAYYLGLDCYYRNDFFLYRYEPMTVYLTVKTAPGVKTPLKVKQNQYIRPYLKYTHSDNIPEFMGTFYTHIRNRKTLVPPIF